MAASESQRLDQFANVLLVELLERTKKNLELLTPEREFDGALPFPMNPSFLDTYAEVIRVGIFPVVFSRRPVRAIVGDVDWEREGREYLQTVMDDRSNAVYSAWDYAWESLWEERKIGTESRANQSKRSEKRGFLSFLFRRRGNEPSVNVASNSDEEGDVMDGLANMLAKLSEKRGYMPMLHDDIKVLKGLVRVKPARLAKAWREISQYYHQEFMMTGLEQAKSGVTNDCLQKWHYSLPDRIGEFLVMKAAIDLEHLNKAYIGKYIRQSARTQEEAERGMPYLTIYWKSLGTKKAIAS